MSCLIARWLHLMPAYAAYGSQATHMVTNEALKERQAALVGDPGTDSSTKVDIPAEQTPTPLKTPSFRRNPQHGPEVHHMHGASPLLCMM